MFGMKTKNALLATVAIGAVAFGTSTGAWAGAKAFSSLQITGFAVYEALAGGASGYTRGAQIDISDLIFLNSIDTTSTSAELSGTSAGGAPSNLALKCVGACGGIAEDDFTMTAPGGNMARADVADSGAIITGLPAGSPATGQTVAEVVLPDHAPLTNQGSSSITNSSTIVFNRDIQLWVEFDAELMMTAEINLGSFIPGTGAAATANFGIDLDETISGNDVFDFNPDGSSDALPLGAAGGEIMDTFSLTSLTVEDLIPDALGDTNNNSGTFVAVTPVLLASLAYNLGIQHETTAQATKVVVRVSEPATLPIMAFGMLFGAAAATRRLRKAA